MVTMYQTAKRAGTPAHDAGNNTEQQLVTSKKQWNFAALIVQVRKPKVMERQTGTAQSSKQNEKRYRSESQKTSISTSLHTKYVETTE